MHGAHQVIESPLAAAPGCLGGLLLEPGDSLLGRPPQLGGIDQLGLSAGGPLLEPLMCALDSGYAPVQVGQCALASLVPVNGIWDLSTCVVTQSGLFPVQLGQSGLGCVLQPATYRRSSLA